MSTAYPSFHFHPSSPTGHATASSSSPARSGRTLGGASKAAVGRVGFGHQATPPASSSPPAEMLGMKRSASGPAAGQSPTKRIVLGSLQPNELISVGQVARRKQHGASTKVISGYATPTSSSPIRPSSCRQALPSSDDLGPPSSSPPSVVARRLPSLKRPVAPRSVDAPLPRVAGDASGAARVKPTSSTCSSSTLAVPSFASTSSTSKSNAAPTVLNAPVPLSPTHTFLLGRTRSTHPLQPKPFGPVPSSVLSRLDRPKAAVLRLPLPRSAKHASRTHVAVELVGSALARVLVLGLNGARVQGRRVSQGEAVLVDGLKRNEVRRVTDGEILKAGSSSSRTGPLRIGFWGVEVIFQWPVGSLVEPNNAATAAVAAAQSRTTSVTASALAADADETESEAQLSSSSISDQSASSDSDEGVGLDSSDEEDEDDAFQPTVRPPSSSILPPSSPPTSLASASPPPTVRRSAPSQLARSRPSSPSTAPELVSSSSAATLSRQATPTVTTVAAPIRTAKIILTRPATTTSNSQSTSTTPAVPASVPIAAPVPVKPVFKPEPREAPLPVAAATPPAPTRPAPAAVDLASLLSSALVFSHVTSLAVPDLVRAVLETSPSLKEHGTIDDWEAWVFEEVNKGGMWGRVIRRGKDASGQPLLDQYFYDPSRDADTTRATDLGSLMRPLRGTQRQGKTYFFKRPSTPGKKRK